MRGGLFRRVSLASFLLGLVLVAVVVALVAANQEVRDDEASAERASTTLRTAAELERLLIDLETGIRGYVITGDPQFLEPWANARRLIPRVSRELVASPSMSSDARRRAVRIAAGIRFYLHNYSIPIRHIAQRNRRAAGDLIATARGKQRVDALRREFDEFVAHQTVLAAARRKHADSQARTASWLAIAGLVISLTLLVLFALYFRRSVANPVRRVAGAARGLAEGDLAARVPRADGGGEVADLGRAFNEMAGRLEHGRTQIEARNTELAEAVERLARQQGVLRAVLDSTPDAIALLDPDGRPVLENPPMRAVREALVSSVKSGGGYITPISDPDVEHEVRDEMELRGLERIYARYRAPVRGTDGALIGSLLALRDITAEREAERAKDEFFAHVSHELRTPLTSIAGYVELVLDDERTPLADQHRTFLETVQRNARRLQRLVGDLLFAAQVEAGQLAMREETVDLAVVVTQSVDAARPRADSAGVTLQLEVTELPPAHGDAERLGQVLDNLISNAIKFTGTGGTVTVSLSRREEDAQIAVADSGIGIPSEEQKHIFERFFRARSATRAAIPGVGLGLTIVRAIVVAHGGNIDVESVPGEGTTFRVRLPLPALRANGAAAGDAPAQSPAPGGR